MRPPRFMPFGKFRGVDVRELPEDYLSWLTTIDTQEPLRTWIAEEAERRWGANTTGVAASVGEAAMRIITAGYRACALRAHPDQGGSTTDMSDTNAAMEILRRYVREELL